ncbi:tRNA (N(6)-L-threonylcarbamoyladenosine(37)-C(2))-methylthiotransferase MtaB [Methylocella sp.]|uniref:tRNA (N(6)-L-threonylcarbamoyladenosine(37)-C(2))- methylthiotransferase MtaB n=1 Tax=Methylocella sp. TaxID=1978226 RepID=UPI00378300CF
MSAPAETPFGVRVESFGCRLNLVESEAMRRAALAAGRENLIIVNSCAVTAEATRQARQTIRRLARENPGAEIVVTGCAAEVEPGRFRAMPEVARVLGNAAKSDPVVWSRRDAAAPGVMERPAAPLPLAQGVEDHTRAFLAVQTGCDHRCTFCVIPYARGPSRSAPPDEILDAARKLSARGFREIVLTGVDLTSYDCGGLRLGGLARAILRAAPGLDRLRLSSIDCVEADAELFAAFAEEERLAPHLHLSLQSGDDLILKRMKRRHSRAEAVEFCAALRRLRPEIAFGADLIAGFPTETEAQFCNTLALVEDCGLTYLHVFPFSPREGTPAARMPQTDPAAARARAARLREKGAEALARRHAQKIGTRFAALAERGGHARAADFTLLRTPGAPPGRMIEFLALRDEGKALSGETLSGETLSGETVSGETFGAAGGREG